MHVQLQSSKLVDILQGAVSNLSPAVLSQLGPRGMQAWEEARLQSWPGDSVEGWELAALLSRTAMPRSLPEVTSRQLAKILRANFPESGPAQALISEPDVEKVVHLVEDLLKDIANATGECPAGLLAKACSDAFTVEKNYAISFGASVARAYSYCKQKAKESTSGKKLADSVRSVVAHIKLVQQGQVRSNLTKGADKIKAGQPKASPSEDEDTQASEVQKQTPPPPLPVHQSRSARSSSSLRRSQAQAVEDSPVVQVPVPKQRKTSKAEIKALFGLGTPSPKKQATSPRPSPSEIVCLDSPSPVATAASRRLNQKTATTSAAGLQTPAAAAAAAAAAASSSAAKGPKGAATASQAQLVEGFDSCKQQYVRTLAGEVIEVAELKPGPDGFCIARFGTEKSIVTEVPNLLMQVLATPFVAKRPASKQGGGKGKKRKKKEEEEEEQEAEEAEAEEPEEEEEEQEAEEAEAEEAEAEEAEAAAEENKELQDEGDGLPEVDFEPEEEEEEQQFGLMFYSTTGKMAIREKKGKKAQVFQFGGKAYTRERLENIGKQCVEKLTAGDNKLITKSWAERELQGAPHKKKHHTSSRTQSCHPNLPPARYKLETWISSVGSSALLFFLAAPAACKAA
jgi:hypothetical protein